MQPPEETAILNLLATTNWTKSRGHQPCDARTDARRISISQVSLPVHFTVFANYFRGGVGGEGMKRHTVVAYGDQQRGSGATSVHDRRRQRVWQTDRHTHRHTHYPSIIWWYNILVWWTGILLFVGKKVPRAEIGTRQPEITAGRRRSDAGNFRVVTIWRKSDVFAVEWTLGSDASVTVNSRRRNVHSLRFVQLPSITNAILSTTPQQCHYHQH